MINRQMVPVQVVTYTTELNPYGERRTQISSTRNSTMMIKIASQVLTNDIRYNDIELIGLTKDNSINSGNEIIYNNIHYNVLYVIPSERYYQILMKRT